MKDRDQKEDIKRKNLLIPEYLDSDPTEYAQEEPIDVKENIKRDSNAILQANLKKFFDIMEDNPSKEELSELAASKGAEFIAEKLFLLSQSGGNTGLKRSNRSMRGKRENQEIIEKKEKYIKNDFKEMVEKKIKALLENKYENYN